ncbi:sulfatase-like hydrolase/transferase, partial [candidate division KSB1 bacterium]|nr:sulfatase-like hydrolase/transferase [candidate division KSB1 bacterium]
HLQHFQEKAASLAAVMPAERDEHAGATKLRQDDAAYATMVHAMDENIGRLLRSLEELELTEQTVIIFTSDNGGLSTRAKNRQAPTSNEPLRAGKGWCYEGGIRAPLIVRAPGITDAAAVCDEPVISMDYVPTMLELAGLPLRPEKHMDGLSLVPLLRGAEQLPRKALYWHYPHYHGSTWTPGAALRAREWKLIEFYEYEKVELYNLKEDVGEKNDLAATLPDKRDELLAKLHSWQRELGAKMPTMNPDIKES